MIPIVVIQIAQVVSMMQETDCVLYVMRTVRHAQLLQLTVIVVA